jgi:hypothetical protein
LYYQLYFNNEPKAGAGDALTIKDVQPPNAGSYYVVVTNFAGSVTSSVASLTISTADADADGLPDVWEKYFWQP